MSVFAANRADVGHTVFDGLCKHILRCIAELGGGGGHRDSGKDMSWATDVTAGGALDGYLGFCFEGLGMLIREYAPQMQACAQGVRGTAFRELCRVFVRKPPPLALSNPRLIRLRRKLLPVVLKAASQLDYRSGPGALS